MTEGVDGKAMPGKDRKMRDNFVKYEYRFEFEGVEFRVYYQPRVGWIVRGDKSYIRIRRIQELASPKVARFVLSAVAKKKCGDDKECIRQFKAEVGETDVLDVITSEVLSKLPTTIKAPSPEDIYKIVLPMWHTLVGNPPRCSVAAALTYKKQIVNEKTTVMEPYILLSVYDTVNDRLQLMEVRLVDALLNGVEVCGTILLVYGPAFRFDEEEDLDIVDIEKKVNMKMKDTLETYYITMPELERIRYWYDVVKDDPVAWLRWTLGAVSAWLRQALWRVYSNTHLRVFELRHATYMYAYVFDYLPHTVFKGPPGSGKSYHIGILTYMLPYALYFTSSTRAAVDRLRTFASIFGIQEIPPEMHDIVNLLIRAYDKYATHAIAHGDGVLVFTGGVALLIGDVGYLKEMDKTGAASTRMMEHYLRIDPKMRKPRHPYTYVMYEFYYRGMAPNGREVELRAQDLWALEVALFLATAHKVYEVYREVGKRIEAEGWHGVDVLPRAYQIYASMMTMAEILGAEYVDALKEWLTKQPREPNYNLMLLAAALKFIIDNHDKEPLRRYLRIFSGQSGEDNNTPLILAPMGAIVEAIALLEQSAVESVTIRRKSMEQDSSFELVDIWRRARLPEAFRDVRRLPDWIKTNSEVGRKLLVLAKSVDYHYRHHLILTPRVVELIAAEALYQYPEDSEVCEILAPHLDLLSTVVDPRNAGILPDCAKGGGKTSPHDSGEPNETVSNVNPQQRQEETLPSSPTVIVRQHGENFTSTIEQDGAASKHVKTPNSGENGGTIENVAPAVVAGEQEEKPQGKSERKKEVYKAEDLFRDI